MRKINFLLAGIATLFMASCSNDEPSNNGGGDNGKDGNESYIAVKIANPTSSRAQAGYEDGSEDESTIEKVYFYFFKGENAFTLYNPDGTASGNMSEVTIKNQSEDKDDTDDIERVADPVIAFRHKKGDFPTHIVAIVNHSLGNNIATVSALKSELTNCSATGKGNFVMSNAMTKDGALTRVDTDNISTTEEGAIAKPITIYVERVLARVDVDGLTPSPSSDYWTLTGETDTNDIQLYAKIEGFDLYNIATNSYAVKNVNFTSDPWTGWSSTYRSFWANTTGITVDNTGDNAVTWNKADKATSYSTYIQENTTDKPTTLVFAATLGTLDGTTFKPTELAYWKGRKIAGEAALKTEMLSELKKANANLWVKDGENWSNITETDLVFVQGTSDNPNSYMVTPTIKTGVTVYKTSGATTSMTDAEIATHFDTYLKTAMIYRDGKTYYYVPIKHEIEGAPKGTEGVVRNHIYDITINSVKGLGTPVYDPDHVIIPQKPEFTESFIAAKLRVLSWRLVTNNVDLGK